jgi:hypothetical protein
MEWEDKVCEFKKYTKQTLDLMTDAFKWKMMGEYSEDEEMKNKYMTVANSLFEMYVRENNNIMNKFRES